MANKISIEIKPVSELNPYENNPRNNDDAVDYVANSIKEFGFKVPIVVDKHNTVITGHTRLKACKKLGIKEVPCIVADDLTEEQVKAFRLADNKVGEIADWDLGKLDIELEDLEQIGDIDMSDFGFDIELEDIAGGQDEGTDEKADEVPKTNDNEPPKAKVGDIYQLGRHRLMCGDSTSVADVEKLINGAHINLALTDPPYGVDIVKGKSVGGGGVTHFGKVGGGKFVNTTEYMPIKGDDSTDTAKQNYSILKDHTDNQIIFGGNYFTDFLPPKACWCIWDKEINGNFADVEMAWTSYDRGAKLYHFLWNGMAREGDRKTELKKRVHPTQKPVGLLADILEDFSNSGENVIDCFGGSGSTLIACEKTDRNCFMLEYEPHYVDVIIKRWEDFTGEKAKLLNEV